MTIPTTPRQPWMREGDRYTWKCAMVEWASPEKPEWLNGDGEWDYLPRRVHANHGADHATGCTAANLRRASLCRIAPARKARRAKGKVVVAWVFIGSDGCPTSRRTRNLARMAREWLYSGQCHAPIHRIEIPAPRAPKGRGK